MTIWCDIVNLVDVLMSGVCEEADWWSPQAGSGAKPLSWQGYQLPITQWRYDPTKDPMYGDQTDGWKQVAQAKTLKQGD